MKKKDLMNFIDVVKEKAIKSVTTKHNNLIASAKEKLFEDGGFNERIKKIQKQVNELQIVVQNLTLDMSENSEINYPNYESYDLLHRLNGFTGEDRIKEQMLYKSKFERGSIPLLIKDKEIELEDVKNNYNKVKYVSQNKSSANDIAKYLEELGFDISSVRKGDDPVALSTEIDKSKLFVCGDNK